MTDLKRIESILLDLLVEIRLAGRSQDSNVNAAPTTLSDRALETDPSLTGRQLWQRERKTLNRRSLSFRTGQVINGKVYFSLGEGSRYTEFTLFVRLQDCVLKSTNTHQGYNLSSRSGGTLETARRLAASAENGDTVRFSGIDFKVIKQ